MNSSSILLRVLRHLQHEYEVSEAGCSFHTRGRTDVNHRGNTETLHNHVMSNGVMVTPLHWSRMCRCSVTAAADCSRRTFDKQLSCVPQLQLSAQLSGGSFPAAGGRAVRPLLRNHLITGLCGRGSSPSAPAPAR